MMRYLLPFSRDQILYCLRILIAVSLAYLLSHGSDPAGALYAVLAAALVVGETAGEGIGISRNRLIGTFIGVAVAVPVSAAGGNSIWAVSGACVGAGLIALLLGEIAMARVAMTVAIVSVLVHPQDVVDYGLFRLTNTAIGIASAVVVTYAFWPIIGRHVLSRALRLVLTDGAELLDTVAGSPRVDLRQRRLRSLFRALSALPKARKEATQDPLLRWHSPVRDETVALVVEIGIHALTISADVGRFGLACRESAWWQDFAGTLRATAQQIRVAGTWFARAKDATPISPHVIQMQLQHIAELERESVEGLLHELRLIHARLGDLEGHVQPMARPRPPRGQVVSP